MRRESSSIVAALFFWCFSYESRNVTMTCVKVTITLEKVTITKEIVTISLRKVKIPTTEVRSKNKCV